MNEVIELRNGAMRCEVLPALGGCVTGLWLDDVPVLRPASAGGLKSARQAGSYPLIPYSNRLAGGRFAWQGQGHVLPPNNPPEPHAIHGTGWQHAWTVHAQDGLCATLGYEHAADESWPFAFSASQVFRVEAGALVQALSITNRAASEAPAGLGWHPWFVKRTRSRIAFEATGRWEMGPDKLPTVHVGSHGIDSDCAFLDIDHCFDGWIGVVDLRDELLHTKIRSDLRLLAVCTDDKRDSIAIEPVSHANNALNLPQAPPMAVLQPGATLTASMRIEVERAK